MEGTQEQGQLSTFEITLLIVQAHGYGVYILIVKWACNVMGVAGQHSHFSDNVPVPIASEHTPLLNHYHHMQHLLEGGERDCCI